MNVLTYTPFVSAHAARRITKTENVDTGPLPDLLHGEPERSPGGSPNVEARSAAGHLQEPAEVSWSTERLVSAKELAGLLGVHLNYVYDLAVEGSLPSYKFGGVRRFDLAEVRGWLADRRSGSDLSV